MSITIRAKLLQEIYRIYDGFIADFNLYCNKSCSTCCTRNITATSLESFLIINQWEPVTEKNLRQCIEAVADLPRFQPHITINQFADLCAKGLETPEEIIDPKVGTCPMLLDGICQIYDVRPFGCRAMVSTVNCAVTGEADMPDFVLAVNNVFLQYIEALDLNGFQGNLIDVLLHANAPARANPNLLTNYPLSVLMIPPAYRERIHPLLDALSKAGQVQSRKSG